MPGRTRVPGHDEGVLTGIPCRRGLAERARENGVALVNRTVPGRPCFRQPAARLEQGHFQLVDPMGKLFVPLDHIADCDRVWRAVGRGCREWIADDVPVKDQCKSHDVLVG